MRMVTAATTHPPMPPTPNPPKSRPPPPPLQVTFGKYPNGQRLHEINIPPAAIEELFGVEMQPSAVQRRIPIQLLLEDVFGAAIRGSGGAIDANVSLYAKGPAGYRARPRIHSKDAQRAVQGWVLAGFRRVGPHDKRTIALVLARPQQEAAVVAAAGEAGAEPPPMQPWPGSGRSISIGGSGPGLAEPPSLPQDGAQGGVGPGPAV